MLYRSVKRIADMLCERLAAVLETPVVVVDQRDVVVASSEPGRVGFPIDWGTAWRPHPVERVPLNLADHNWHLVIDAEPDRGILAHHLLQHLVALLLAEEDSPAALPPPAELRNTLLYDLLRGAPLAEAEVARLGQILGLHFSWPRAVMLIHAGEFLQPAERNLRGANARLLARSEGLISTLCAMFPTPYDPICAYIGAGQLALLAAPAGEEARPGQELAASPDWAELEALKRLATGLIQRLSYETHGLITIGLGRYHPGMAGLARSYRDAATALSIGLRLHGPAQLYCLDTLGTAAYVALDDEETKIDLAGQRLHPLRDEPELIETLNVFFAESCSPTPAANRLAVHRNTLAYRFDKIAGLTGLDPRRFEDAIQLRLALILCELDTSKYPSPHFEQIIKIIK